MTLASTKTESRIAVITIDNPPVSAGHARLRRDLFDELSVQVGSKAIDAIVLNSAQRHFYSGSDIREFDGEIAEPTLPELTDLLGKIEVPVVAALNGATLGGGLELAMACDVRIAASDAKLGLPEMTLGMLPGAGGTVRLPRLVGLAEAVSIIGGAKQMSASEALKCGLVDEVVDPADLQSRALQLAKSAKKRNSLQLTPPPSAQSDLDQAIARVSKRARPNVEQAIRLIVEGVSLPADEALARERSAFDGLRVGAEARNLRYLFFAKRAAAKDLTGAARAKKTEKVGVAGAGTMGARIAEAFLSSGIDVVLYELNAEVLDRAKALLGDSREAGRGELTPTQDLKKLANVGLVIDAVFEDMQVKTDLFRDVERNVTSSTVLASNSSYLDLNELSASLSEPERFLGIHFFNPADRNPLLEIVKTESAGVEALAVAAGVARSLGKTPILAQVADGFVANRVYADYRSQAEFLVEDGASPREVDDAMRSLGLPIGPFAVADMSGLDIAWARRKRLAATRNPQQRYVTIADTLCESNRIGKKVGAGWYRYTDEHPRGVMDDGVEEIIRNAREDKGIAPRAIDTAEIQRRIICSMLVASATLVESGVAQRASDIDVALTEGFAFPAWLGGSIRYAAAHGTRWVIRGLREVYESDPIGFATAEPAADNQMPEAIVRLLESVR